MNSIQLCFLDIRISCYHYRMRLRPICLHLDTKFVKMLDWPFFGYSLAIFFTMFSVKPKTVSICLSNSQTLSRYQKNIGKMVNNRSKI